MTNGAVRWLALAAVPLGLATGCTPAPRKAAPPMFVLRDADTTIWLMGTIHALPDGVDWRSVAVDRAIADADALVTEVPATTPDAAAAAFLRRSRGTGAPTILARVAENRRPALASAIASAGLSADTLSRLKTWAAAILLANSQLRAQGVSPDPAPEAVLARAFAKRPRLAFETSGGQLAFFDALTESDQRALLDDAIDAPAQYQRTLDAWAAGDVAALAATLQPLAAKAPGATAVLVTHRNGRWAGWIAQRMAWPGKLLVAVGAGHLAGRQSVIALLRARGFSVAQVR